MNTNQPLSTALTSSLKAKSLIDLAIPISETVVDSLLDPGLWRDIPIFGTISGIINVGIDIKNRIFLQKIVTFLKEMSNTSTEDRIKFVEQFNSDEERHKFGQAILMLIEQADDMRKPQLVARIINAHIEGHFDLTKAMRLCSIVNKCYTQDLNILENFSEGTQAENSAIAESLFAVGLLSQGGIDSGSWDGNDGGMIFVMNEYGRLLKEHVLFQANT